MNEEPKQEELNQGPNERLTEFLFIEACASPTGTGRNLLIVTTAITNAKKWSTGRMSSIQYGGTGWKVPPCTCSMYMSVVFSILALELPKNDVTGCYRRGNACAALIPGDSHQMQSLAMPRRVETVLQVPPPAALVVEPETTYTPLEMEMGMGGQSGAVEKATRAHRRRAVPFGSREREYSTVEREKRRTHASLYCRYLPDVLIYAVRETATRSFEGDR
jgi:hypothetical protein